MPDLVLAGCRAEPLSSYLKALGVLRIVTEQLDEGATGRWSGDGFVLDTDANEEEVAQFFLQRYRPTPVIAPWNGRSMTALHDMRAGKAEKKNALRDVMSLENARASDILGTILAADAALAKADALGIDPRKKGKRAFVLLCRNTFPDVALEWLDAVVVLTGNDVAFPLLTGGTGGVLGSGDISLNFLAQLPTVLADDGETRDLLDQALFLRSRPKLHQPLVGQFDPGAAGGSGVGESRVNPWDLVLLVEGSLLFAGAAARRMGLHQSGTAAMPFTVRGTAAGFGSAAADEDTKGEVWAPIWRAPAHLREIRQLVSEGRASWNGRQAQNALDFARAVGSLGVDRGIDHFMRFSIGVRHGQANLAVPVGRVSVQERANVPVMSQLDWWLRRISGVKAPSAAVAHQLRKVESSALDAATSDSPNDLQELLIQVATLDRTIGKSAEMREKIPPLSSLRATGWIPLLDDRSVEFRLAQGFASLRDQARGYSWLRVVTQEAQVEGSRLTWERNSPPPLVSGAASRPILAILSDCVARRAIEPRSDVHKEIPGAGALLGFCDADRVPLSYARRFYAGAFDRNRFARLLLGLMLLFWEGNTSLSSTPTIDRVPVPPAFSVMAPFGHHGAIHHPKLGEVLLRADPHWPTMLTARRVAPVLEEALRRLSIAHIAPPPLSPSALATGVEPSLLAASLLLPLTPRGLISLLNEVTPPHDGSISN